MKKQIRGYVIKKKGQVEEEPQKTYDLEERTFKFAKATLAFLKCIDKSMANQEFARQLIRSSSSVGANYLEANNFLGKKDFTHKIGICRKEAKESNYWFKLIEIDEDNPSIVEKRDNLAREAIELMLIFSAIFRKNR